MHILPSVFLARARARHHTAITCGESLLINLHWLSDPIRARVFLLIHMGGCWYGGV
jgi:hypothetical protein